MDRIKDRPGGLSGDDASTTPARLTRSLGTLVSPVPEKFRAGENKYRVQPPSLPLILSPATEPITTSAHHQNHNHRLWPLQGHSLSRLRPRSAYVFKLHPPANIDIFSILVHLLLNSSTSRTLLSFELTSDTPSLLLPSQLPHRTNPEILPPAEEGSQRQGPLRCIGADLKPP